MRATVVLFAIIVASSSAVAQGVNNSIGSAMTQPDASAALAGKSWQLVQIMSMDDTTHVPAQRADYTLFFGSDGSLQVRADCNRGSGTWQSPTAGKLSFGEIAAPQAQCPPGSLHDVFLAQFPWVRSYVMRDGNLFLATMADGSIIEFTPAAPVAKVLGREIYGSNASEMQQAILSPLFERYARERGLSASDAEVAAFVDNMQRGMRAQGLTAEDELSPEEAAEVAQMRRDMARAMIGRWKLNRALYSQYGGRIIYQQFGPEPLDAYRQYLEACQAAGDFEIRDQAMAEAFWRYFRDDSKHQFFEPGSEAEAQAFATPPWESKPSNPE